MVPILINKDMFKSSYNDLKFRSEIAITFVPTLYFLNLWMRYLVCVCVCVCVYTYIYKHTYNKHISTVRYTHILKRLQAEKRLNLSTDIVSIKHLFNRTFTSSEMRKG